MMFRSGAGEGDIVAEMEVNRESFQRFCFRLATSYWLAEE